MSAFWLRTATFLCLGYTALTEARVIWKHVGEDVTIQCRINSKQDSLSLFRGLSKDVQLFYTSTTNKNTFGPKIQGRSQTNGVFPGVDILIKNLTLDDTGPYWCLYKKMVSGTLETTEGQGSVLLVVTENRAAKTTEKTTVQECDPSQQSLVVVSVVISGAVLLGIILAIIIWIVLKTKTSCPTAKPTRVTTNDVYEEMRGTQRR
ncbi:uncharacterized protein PAE49_023136 [Odontesthes bonariensis]|uniref:uncharacterized protein LOC142371636 n=1 Tax=Odontesthes bonariensis TaxID=219752 RepID=UPI003F5804B2